VTYGESARKARLNAGLTMKALGYLSGVDYRTIGRLERDEKLPLLHKIIAVADALGLTIDEYIGHTKGGHDDRD
jgi:transcriptional regulator with XRE-family HTH domain